MNAFSSTALQQRLFARLRSASACAFLVGAPVVARAQTSTLPPTDISNQAPTPSPGAAPPPAPPPGLPPESEPVPPAPVAPPAAPLPVPAPPPPAEAPPVPALATPVVPPLALPVSGGAAGGLQRRERLPALARQRLHPLPERPPAGRHLPLPLLGRQEQGQDPEQHLPAPPRAPRAGGLDRILRLLLAGGRLRARPASGGRAGRPREPRHHRRLRRARALEQPGDPAGRPVRRPVHAREPDLGQVLRLHGTFDHRARLRHPRQQGDGGDAARVQR